MLRGCPSKNRTLDFRPKTEFLQIFRVRQLVHMINKNGNNLAYRLLSTNLLCLLTIVDKYRVVPSYEGLPGVWENKGTLAKYPREHEPIFKELGNETLQIRGTL